MPWTYKECRTRNESGIIWLRFRGSARRGAHKSADSRTDLSPETIEDQESFLAQRVGEVRPYLARRVDRHRETHDDAAPASSIPSRFASFQPTKRTRCLSTQGYDVFAQMAKPGPIAAADLNASNGE